MNKLFFKTFIFLMKIIQIFLLLNKGTKIFINCHSIISLIIQGKGNQKILYNEFPTSPSEIRVNGVINNCDKTCELQNDINNITLIFNYEIASCQKMFYSLENITEVDLSNFNCSRINDVSSMFYGCSNLEKINFGNIDTFSVNYISSIFMGCSKLTSIDLSKFDISRVTDMSYMFYRCSNLENINFGNILASSVQEMISIFEGCSKLTSIDLSIFNTKKVNVMKNMFYGCSNLKIINFSNIDTSFVIDMSSMFRACSKLTSIDLSKFNTSRVTSMSNMFYGCTNLEIINFGNIDTSFVTDMSSMFRDCFNLTSIDLSKFDTSRVTDMSYMFYNCSNIKFLNLSNIKTINLTNINYMFMYCSSLIYLNIYLFKFNNLIQHYDTFYGLSSNIRYCIQDIETKNFLLGNNTISLCSDECIDEKNTKIDISNNKCLESCLNYTYEYNNICYNKCPEGTYPLYSNVIEEDINAKECYNEIPLGYYLDLNEEMYKACYDTCIVCNGPGNKSFHNCEKCKLNLSFLYDSQYKSNCYKNCVYSYYFDEKNEYYCMETYDEKEYMDKILKNLKEIMNNYNTSDIDNGNDYIYTEKQTTYTITSTENQKNQKNKNITTIDLGECETKLKLKYSIPKNNSLYILKVDTWIDGMLKIEYEIYYPLTLGLLSKLNLSICKDIKIEITRPIDIPLDEIDKYNMSSDIYNDICYTLTSDAGTDISLKDRQNEYVNNNMSICEENCDFSNYDDNTKKATCSCFVKMTLPLISEIKFDKKKLFSNFKDIRNIGNFEMLNCIDLLFDKNNIFKNSANFLLISLSLLSIASLFVFIFYDRIKIKNYINSISVENIKKKKKMKKKKINKNIINIPEKKVKNIINQNEIRKVNKSKNNKNILNMNKNLIKNDKINNNLYQDSKIILKNKTNNNFSDNELTKIAKSIKSKKSNKKIKLLNDTELNSLKYEEALEKDKRTYIQYYLSLLRTKHILVFTFFQFKDYNSRIIKICIFFLTFYINFTVSAMFYSDSTMNKIYVDEGSFDFTYQLPQMFYSLIISTILKTLLNFLGLYEKHILEMKNNKLFDKLILKEYFKIKCKISLFFSITYILLFFSWIYLGCFCAVYKNTQVHLLIDVASSFGISFITPLFINLFPGIFRILSLKDKQKPRPRLFKFSKFLQIF